MRIPGDLTIVMSMNVYEARRYRHSGGINFLTRFSIDGPDSTDHAILDGHVAFPRLIPTSVDQRSPSNDQIVHGIPHFPAAPAWGLASDSVYERNGALREGQMSCSPRSGHPLAGTNRGRALLFVDGVSNFRRKPPRIG